MAEAISFLVLVGIAMPLKYLAGKPEAVRIMGSLHGGLFVIYILMALLAARKFHWRPTLLILALVAAVIPFGPFWFDAKLRRETA